MKNYTIKKMWERGDKYRTSSDYSAYYHITTDLTKQELIQALAESGEFDRYIKNVNCPMFERHFDVDVLNGNTYEMIHRIPATD